MENNNVAFEVTKSWVLGMDAYQTSDKTHEIRLVNGKIITVEEEPEYNGSLWEYSVDGQYFSEFGHACDYLHRLIAEKISGVRYIYHQERAIPNICGNESCCRHKNKCNTMLCSDCPVAEKFFAERDGVTLVYAVC